MFHVESFPLRRLRRQAKVQLEEITTSFQNKTVLITGANGSFGSAAAQLVVDLQVETLILTVRDNSSGEALKENLLSRCGNNPPNIIVWQLDLSSFANVESLAVRVNQLPRLDAAIMNAGVYTTIRSETKDGWESSMQVNFLSTSLLACLLLPILKQTANHFHTQSVLTFVVSWGVRSSFSSLKVKPKGQLLRAAGQTTKFEQSTLQYGKSKLLLLYFGRQLATHIGKNGAFQETDKSSKPERIIINYIDPGTAATKLTSVKMSSGLNKLLLMYIGRPADACAKTIVKASQGDEGTHGKLLQDYTNVPFPVFMETEKAQEMQEIIWEETKEVLGEVSVEAKDIFKRIEAGDY